MPIHVTSHVFHSIHLSFQVMLSFLFFSVFMLILVSPMLNITFITKCCERTHKHQAISRHTRHVKQNPSHSPGSCVPRYNTSLKRKNTKNSKTVKKRKNQMFIQCTLPLQVIQLFNHERFGVRMQGDAQGR